MKVDLSKPIVDIISKKNAQATEGVDLLLKKVCVDAVLFESEESQKDSGEEKVKRYKLAVKISDSQGIEELSAEEISLLKSKISKSWPTMVVGQAFDLLEGN